jgi:small subunit ribosomal protein S20
MANTRKSAKRAIQAKTRQARNQTVRSATRTAVRTALDAIKTQDVTKAQEAYKSAVKALSKAASKGALPKGRAARKVSRLTHFVKKALPAMFAANAAKKAPAAASKSK